MDNADNAEHVLI